MEFRKFGCDICDREVFSLSLLEAIPQFGSEYYGEHLQLNICGECLDRALNSLFAGIPDKEEETDEEEEDLPPDIQANLESEDL